MLILSMQQRHVEVSQKGGNHAIRYVSITRNKDVGIHLCITINRDSSVKIQGCNIIIKILHKIQSTQTIVRNESVRKMYDFAYHPLYI